VDDIVLSVSDFVALVNQTLEYAFNSVVVVGELANFRISKNKWVYFDLKDELASVRFFGTVYALPGPLEDGMMLEVRGNPRLHPQFGFSVTVQSMRPVGEGSIKKAANLLEAKLRREGLFDEERKRTLPYPPETIGLVTSKESAAYADFVKVLGARWRGLEIQHIDVQVQGELAVPQIVEAIEQLNQSAVQPDVLVVVRGGGSADDLQAFSTEQVTRAIAGSRIPTLVAIGHEIDTSLAELAADCRASTPSNAAELLVPDRGEVSRQLSNQRKGLLANIENLLAKERKNIAEVLPLGKRIVQSVFEYAKQRNARQGQLVEALSPKAALKRGFAIVRDKDGKVIRSGKVATSGIMVYIQLADASIDAQIKQVNMESNTDASQ
jgi:exodeoxyribonuclease VII large subunit